MKLFQFKSHSFPSLRLQLFPSAMLSSPPTPPPPETVFPAVKPAEMSRTLTALGIGVGLGGFLALFFTMCFYLCFCKWRKRKTKTNKNDYFDAQPQKWQENVSPKKPKLFSKSTKSPILPHSPSSIIISPSKSDDDGVSNMTFSYEELARATDNFSLANLLGQGGFGHVHKGLLPSGKEIAVKKLKFGGGQGEREFQAEVDTISRVKHKHLVSLVGYCICGDQRLLVYEFVANKTLDFHLHEGRPPMNWSTRLKVALGAARGLTYLHEDCHPKIIHRDIKASNILLDDSFVTKDFGLARFSDDNDTHVSTRVMGTFGYLAPEYASSGKLTEKSDVYSFGVVLLELITGRRPIDKGQCFIEDSMVEWARPLLREALETGKFGSLIDPNLKDYISSEMSQMVACAASCVQHSARRRPRMSQIVEALEGNLSIEELCSDMSPTSSAMCASSDNDQYKENLKKFKKLVLESQGLSASELGAIDSDFGALNSASSVEIRNESDDTGSPNSVKQGEVFLEISIL